MQSSTTPLVKLALVLLSLFFMLQLSCAAPVPLDDSVISRDVYVPTIITPNATAIWPIGSVQNVTWDTKNPPEQITNKRGRILLRSEETGRLNVKNPLAVDFDILNGTQEVTVPDVKPGIYQIVLFGNSGNWGESFQIVPAETEVDDY